jgi:hypothetical protein
MAEETPAPTPEVKPTPTPNRKKTGTSADEVDFGAELTRQLKELQDSFNTNHKTNEAKLAALPELQAKVDKILETHGHPRKPASFWESLWGDFWEGFF